MSWPGEIEKKFSQTRGFEQAVWIRKELDGEWEENEKNLAQASKRIQVLVTKSQADPMNEEEAKEFDLLQKQYISMKAKREEMISATSELAVFLPPRAEGKKSEISDGEPPWVRQENLKSA